jgi:hypothetical protein
LRFGAKKDNKKKLWACSSNNTIEKRSKGKESLTHSLLEKERSRNNSNKNKKKVI